MVSTNNLLHQDNVGEIQFFELEARYWLGKDSTHKLLIIHDDNPTRLSKPEGLSLDLELPDGSNLQDQINAEWLHLILKCVYLVRDDQDLSTATAKSHVTIINRILTFLQWCRLKGFYSLRHVTPEVVEQFSADIALGTGHALQYTNRIKTYFEKVKDDLPITRDKYYKKRVILDVESICKTIGIPKQGLSSDRTASQLIARKSAQIGYRYPGQQKPTEGPLPAPTPVSTVTHHRFIHVVRLLHKWNSQLEGSGLSFVGCPLVTDVPRSQMHRKKQHTKNIPPLEAMQLLNESLRWIHSFAPRLLDLFDDVERYYKELIIKAESIDRLSTPESAEELRRGVQRYLESENQKNTLPHGVHQLLGQQLKLGYISACHILNGNFKRDRRQAVLTWLNLDPSISDRALLEKIKHRLSEDPRWNVSWPLTENELATRIGISARSIQRLFRTDNLPDQKILIALEKFLLDQGAIEAGSAQQTTGSLRYRFDRGIESKLEEFIENHPLNAPDGGGPFPMKWNLTVSSRSGGMSLYEALRFSIPTAGLVVLGVFTARRESELLGLTTDCIAKDNDSLWLESYIAKTLRSNRKLPTVQGVATTVEILTRWGKRGKSGDSDNRLFSYWDPFGDDIVITKPNQDLNRFALYALNNSPTHSLQVRQFRRFFAITFMWRYRAGSLPALSDFLCHRGVSMTWEYVREVVGSAVLFEAQAEFSREILLNAAIGKTSITGNFAKTWNRWVEKVRTQIRDSLTFTDEPEAATVRFEERIEVGIRMLMPTPHGACAAGTRERDNRRAKCAMPDETNPENVVKKPELATAVTCSKCPFAITDNVHKDYWISAAKEARAAASSLDPSLLRDRALQDAPALEKFVQKFFEEFPK